jgi:hypothetical protein
MFIYINKTNTVSVWNNYIIKMDTSFSGLYDLFPTFDVFDGLLLFINNGYESLKDSYTCAIIKLIKSEIIVHHQLNLTYVSRPLNMKQRH